MGRMAQPDWLRFAGVLTFTYVVSDTVLASGPATVTLTLLPDNNYPLYLPIFRR